MQTRKPIVAGQFYPGQHDACIDQINRCLDAGTPDVGRFLQFTLRTIEATPTAERGAGPQERFAGKNGSRMSAA